MLIDSDLEIVGLCLYLRKEKTLVMGDVHIGYEEALNKQGVLIPRFQFKEMMEELKRTYETTRPERVVLLGDLKHEFGTISDQEWRETLKFLDYLLEKSKVVLLKGNHDTILGPLVKKRGLEIKKSHAVGEFFFCHGDEILSDLNSFKKAKTLVIGHEHPAISLREGGRVEKYKCFLVGKYLKKRLIVMPSFNSLVEGKDVLQEKLLSPYLKEIDDFKVIISSDKIYDFGLVKQLRKH